MKSLLLCRWTFCSLLPFGEGALTDGDRPWLSNYRWTFRPGLWDCSHSKGREGWVLGSQQHKRTPALSCRFMAVWSCPTTGGRFPGLVPRRLVSLAARRPRFLPLCCAGVWGLVKLWFSLTHLPCVWERQRETEVRFKYLIVSNFMFENLNAAIWDMLEGDSMWTTQLDDFSDVWISVLYVHYIICY